MSKLGRVNLELQEQANELGFSTVQEALDNGYRDVYNPETGEARLLPSSVDEELEEAHEAWLKEKKEVLGLLDKLAAAVEGAYDGKFDPETAAISFDDGTTEISYKDITHIKEFIEKGEE